MKLTNFINLLAAAFVVSAAAGVAASCQQDPAGPENPDLGETTDLVIPVSVEGSISCDDPSTPSTKVTVNPTTGVTAWETNDPIAVYVSGTGANKYVDAAVTSNSVRLSLTSGQTRSGYAIYPRSSAGSTTPTVVYPSSYDMYGKDVTSANTWAPTPMVADNTKTDLSFFHVGGLIRLHVTEIPSGTTTLIVTFTGLSSPNYVAGTFTVNNPGTNTATTTYSSSPNGAITFSNLSISNSEVYLNIPVPTIDLTALTGIQVRATGGTDITTTKAVSGWGPIAHGTGKKVDVSFISVTHSSGYTGRFRGYELSKGYLVWDTTAGEYKLSDPDDPFLPIRYYGTSGDALTAALNTVWHQWGGSGLDNSLKGRIDGNPAATANITNGLAVDGLVWKIPSNTQWGSIIGNGPSCTINSTTAGYSVVRVSLAGATSVGEEGYDYHSKGLNNTSGGAVTGNNGGFQVGLLLVPDYTAVSCPGITANNKNFTAGTTISWTALKQLLDGGCVFLPAAGYYSGGWGRGGSYGTYWSATQRNGSNAYILYIDTSTVSGAGDFGKYYYMPVRLIRE